MTDPKRRTRPRDANALAKLIVDIAVGEEEDAPESKKDPSRVERGRKGGLIGGRVRANRMNADERRQASKVAAQARWASD